MSTCADCGAELPLKILTAAGGFYLATVCPACGPTTQETAYHPTYAAALADLEAKRRTLEAP